jgi:hypothetical protein
MGAELKLTWPMPSRQEEEEVRVWFLFFVMR